MKRRGNCYVTCEALFHLLGGKASGWVPHTVRHEGDVHWYLVNKHGLESTTWPAISTGLGLRSIVLDPTAAQFKIKPPYHLGRGRGFLTKQPSKRARALMDQMLWQKDNRP